jgi:hypothetical protein
MCFSVLITGKKKKGKGGTNSRVHATVIPERVTASPANVFADRKKNSRQGRQGQNGHRNLLMAQVIDNGSVV